jgi:frataxin-like iron-binding protein CyaY
MFCRRWWLIGLVVCGGFSSVNALGQSGNGTESGAPDAASETDSQSERFIISTGQSDQALAALRPEQAIWLETNEHGRVLALLDRERGGAAKGAVIIFGDVGQTADTGLTGALREPLAEAGWAALSLGLPQPPNALLQWRESSASSPPMPSSDNGKEATMKSDTAAETDASAQTSAVIDVMEGDSVAKVRDAYQARLKDHLATAAQKLSDMGYGPLVFVGIGRGADAVTAYMLEQDDPDAMIWIAPKLTGAHLASLAEGNAGSAPAILDLVSTQGRGNEAATRRSSRLSRDKVAGYGQQTVAMPPQPKARDARQIVNRITGWMRSEQ